LAFWAILIVQNTSKHHQYFFGLLQSHELTKDLLDLHRSCP